MSRRLSTVPAPPLPLAIIPAKAHSTRCTGKNLRSIGPRNLPMALYTVEAAVDALGGPERVVLVTDSPKLRDLAGSLYKVHTPVRPAHLAEAGVSATEVVLWCLTWAETMGLLPPDCEHTDGPLYRTPVLQLLPTSPLRTAQDIGAVLASWQRCHHWESALVTCTSLHAAAVRTTGPQGWLSRLPGGAANMAWLSNGAVQVAALGVLRNYGRFHIPKCFPYPLPLPAGLDVDTDFDLALADHLLHLGY